LTLQTAEDRRNVEMVKARNSHPEDAFRMKQRAKRTSVQDLRLRLGLNSRALLD
jgi:hypothetical protein